MTETLTANQNPSISIFLSWSTQHKLNATVYTTLSSISADAPIVIVLVVFIVTDLGLEVPVEVLVGRLYSHRVEALCLAKPTVGWLWLHILMYRDERGINVLGQMPSKEASMRISHYVELVLLVNMYLIL